MAIKRDITAKALEEWLERHTLCYASGPSKGTGYKYLDVQLGTPRLFKVYTTDDSDAGSRKTLYTGPDPYKAVGVYNES